MMLFAEDFWMQGTWVGPLVGTSNQDIYGAPITLGSIVKFVGQVTAINLSDPHYGEIQVMPIHPGSIGPIIPDVQTTLGAPQSYNFSPDNPQSPTGPFGFHPKQLVVGT